MAGRQLSLLPDLSPILFSFFLCIHCVPEIDPEVSDPSRDEVTIGDDFNDAISGPKLVCPAVDSSQHLCHRLTRLQVLSSKLIASAVFLESPRSRWQQREAIVCFVCLAERGAVKHSAPSNRTIFFLRRLFRMCGARIT